jgi:hypothetical protein
MSHEGLTFLPHNKSIFLPKNHPFLNYFVLKLAPVRSINFLLISPEQIEAPKLQSNILCLPAKPFVMNESELFFWIPLYCTY